MRISGKITWDIKNEPIANIVASFISHDGYIVKTTTSKEGDFLFRIATEQHKKNKGRALAGTIQLSDKNGYVFYTVRNIVFEYGNELAELYIQVPVKLKSRSKKLRPTVKAGSILLDAFEFEKLKPEILYIVARAMIRDKAVTEKQLKQVKKLSPELLVPELASQRITLCSTNILETVYEIIRLKNWPREIPLQIEDILTMRPYDLDSFSYDCGNFLINYSTSGVGAVDPGTATETVIDPGSSPAVVLATLTDDGITPTYIKRVCFWLERALTMYTSAPFSMRNPAASGRIEVTINSSRFGSATPFGFYLQNDMHPDLLADVAVHELFHRVQYMYAHAWGSRYLWPGALIEGGATFAEDTIIDNTNRYLDEAGTNFNGPGVMDDPIQPICNAGYKASLFLKYIAEQQSARIITADEPMIGVETYRALIESCAAGTWSNDDMKRAIRSLPWYYDFYEFAYLDAVTRLDRTSSETIFGNYALACYLKRLGNNIPDRRFDFMEDNDNIYLDDVIRTVIPTAPLQTQLAQVNIASSTTLTNGGPLVFSGLHYSFGHLFYEILVDPTVTNAHVSFTADPAFTSLIFQVVLIDEDGLVRDIHRTDAVSYNKYITNIRDTKRLSKILVVVTAADSGGNFTVTVEPTTSAPDVMVTKWHSIMKTEYEIDSGNWSWTWVSPDIWVDNDANGIADSEIYFDFDNQLKIRLHNKGNADASGIQVQFDYQDASGGLSDAAWLPVQNRSGVLQVLTGLNLSQATSDIFTVDWSPLPSGTSQHFCIRAIVTVPFDPNIDNKRVLSNFGNVITAPGHFAEISLIRRNIFNVDKEIKLKVIPRLSPDLRLSVPDITRQSSSLMKPGETIRDVIRVNHLDRLKSDKKPMQHTHLKGSRYLTSPDPLAYYSTPKEALPPGIAGKPMITVVHEVNGMAIGGVSFHIKVKERKLSVVKKME